MFKALSECQVLHPDPQEQGMSRYYVEQYCRPFAAKPLSEPVHHDWWDETTTKRQK